MLKHTVRTNSLPGTVHRKQMMIFLQLVMDDVARYLVPHPTRPTRYYLVMRYLVLEYGVVVA